METKTTKAIALWRAGEVKKALSIFATFKIGFTKYERRTIQIAAEIFKGYKVFYQQLGIDTDKEIEVAKKIINSKYNKVMNEVWYVTEDFDSMVGNVYVGTLEECEAELNRLREQYLEQGKNPDVFNITFNRFDI